ncbi:MAG: hypothetical protein ACR2GY_00580 [Phycisphaerales bacterium]
MIELLLRSLSILLACVITCSVAAQAGEVQVAVYVPEPVEQSELNYYAMRLTLTDAQRTLAEALFKEYQQAWRDRVARSRDELNEAARRPSRMTTAAMAADNNLMRDPAVVDAFEELCNLRKTIVNDLDAIDARFLEDLLLLAGVSEAERGDELAALQRTRFREAYPRVPLSLPWAHRDLVDLVEECNIAWRDDADVRAILESYEVKVVPIRREAVERMFTLSLKAKRLWMDAYRDAEGQLREIGSPEYRVRAVKAAAYNERLYADEKEISIEAGEITFDAVEKMLAALPGDAAKRLEQTFNQRAFFEMYPDLAAAHHHFRLLREDDSLDEDVHAAIDVLHARYDARYRAMCARMKDNLIERRTAVPMLQSDARRTIVTAFDRLKSERAEINAIALKQLAAMLGQEYFAGIAERVERGQFDRID